MQILTVTLALAVCLFGGASAQLDGCDPSPCVRGSCVPSYDQYICQCPANYYGDNCDVLALHPDGVCPGGHIYQSGEIREYVNLPHTEDCYYLIAIPNVPEIEIEFLDFSIEIAKDEVVIGPGTVVDPTRTLPTTFILDNATRPIDNPLYPDNMITISGSRAWVNIFTDKNIVSSGVRFRVFADALDCLIDPCVNGATCVDLVNSFSCTCPSSFTGQFCEIELDFCSSNPCLNGGTCTADNNGYTCACVAGWTDVNCGTDINECASTPCLNGGTCYDGIDAWACQCPPQWTGEICQISLNPCGIMPCLNGATCVNAGNDYICECPPGFVGELCETDINECSSLPCQNGGTCINGAAMYECQCREGFTGLNCEEVGYCNLPGEWYNECNDRITISLTSTGMVLGEYASNINLLTGYTSPNVMVGYANQNCDFPSFGFVVTTDNGKSTSSWSGQCHLCGGEEVLYTTWTNTQRVNTCVDIKTATHIGQDRWTRYRQSQAPREEE